MQRILVAPAKLTLSFRRLTLSLLSSQAIIFPLHFIRAARWTVLFPGAEQASMTFAKQYYVKKQKNMKLKEKIYQALRAPHLPSRFSSKSHRSHAACLTLNIIHILILPVHPTLSSFDIICHKAWGRTFKLWCWIPARTNFHSWQEDDYVNQHLVGESINLAPCHPFGPDW